MFLKRIELQGFKSFADKTIIQFDHDITGIVGPNGCGKSNVNDAIRWVLGEQSVKSLRSGTSMSDIIFSGSEYRRPVNIAKVTLVFDNANKVFDSEFEEIEITRQLQRSTNEASYFINKTPCRLKDINDLVMDTGLGRDSLSIITQGNISSFADAKPEERRSLFEEAAGVAKYKKRKQISLRKLEQTQANLDRLQDILDELKRQLGPLERQAKKAKEYIGLKDELSKIEISVLVEEIDTYNEQINQIQKDLIIKQSDQLTQEKQVDQLDEQVVVLRKEMYEMDAKINDLQGQYTRAMTDSYQLEKRKIEIDEKRKYALSQAGKQERREQLVQLLQDAQYEFEDRKSRLELMQTESKLHQSNLDKINQELSQLSHKLTQEQASYQRLSNRKHVLENMIRQPFQNQAGVRSIMEAKQSLHGIEGVVSELLVADKDKAQAIQAALGGSMYQIVTANEESARYAIGFLKKNQSGRATFLPMTVCKPRFASNQQVFVAEQSKGYIGLASECVTCHEKYNDVRDRLLGNVIVVDTLENANECAKRLEHRLKIVTLDGDIVHTGGSMTGGRGKNQSSPVTMRQELETITEQLTSQQSVVSDLENRVRQLQRDAQQENDTCVRYQVNLAKLENVYEVKKEKYESYRAEYQEISPDDIDSIESSQDEIVVAMSKMHAKIDDLTSNLQTMRQQRFDTGEKVEQLENQMRTMRRDLNSLQQDIHNLDVAQTKYKTQLDNALMRLNSDYQMTYEYASTQKEEIDIKKSRDQVNLLRQQIASLGNVNLDAPEQFDELNERYSFLIHQKEDLEKASAQILDAIDEMDETMKVQFTDMFNKINKELNQVFQSMFGGGRAKLSMVDPDDVLNTGIDIDVQPPGKMVKNIQTFSGGEKALIAISVLFAILQARTMPLCIFDEVEAALDQANVERFARYIGNFRGQSQFIVVTHRPGTMEKCDTLYGVTMQQDGVSQLLKVELKDAVSYTEKEVSN